MSSSSSSRFSINPLAKLNHRQKEKHGGIEVHWWWWPYRIGWFCWEEEAHVFRLRPAEVRISGRLTRPRSVALEGSGFGEEDGFGEDGGFGGQQLGRWGLWSWAVPWLEGNWEERAVARKMREDGGWEDEGHELSWVFWEILGRWEYDNWEARVFSCLLAWESFRIFSLMLSVLVIFFYFKKNNGNRQWL